MKKMMALALAGALLCTTPVMAANSPSASAVSASVQDVAVERAAAQANMTVGEYRNNTVTSTPGLEDAAQIGQGGHVILNGAPSNATFQLVKATRATTESAKTLAAGLGGKVLNVVGTKSSVGKFQTARVNFYLEGVVFGQNVMVFQLVDGVWVPLNVAEIREDHVVVDMQSHGVLAFVAL